MAVQYYPFQMLGTQPEGLSEQYRGLTEIFPDADSLGMKEDLLYRDYISEVQRRLSPAELAAFNCIVVEHMSLKEAAEYLEISQITLRVRWSRTREHIKKTIGSIIGFG